MSWKNKASLAALIGCCGLFAGLYFFGIPLDEPAMDAVSVPVREIPLSLSCVRAVRCGDVNEAAIFKAIKKLVPGRGIKGYNAFIHKIHLFKKHVTKFEDGEMGEFLECLFDSKKASEKFGTPIQMRRRFGFEYHGSKKPEHVGERHSFQTIAALAEAGFSSRITVRIEDQDVALADGVRWMLASVNDDAELEWTVVGAALYVPTKKKWRNKFGEEISFDHLCDRLCSVPLGEGSCLGTHNLYSLVVLLMCDDHDCILSGRARDRAIHRLREAVSILEMNQKANGFWVENWHSSKPELKTPSATFYKPIEVLVTSHHLEWLALAPSDVDLSKLDIKKACGALLAHVCSEESPIIDKYFCPYSHAVSALCLWFPGTMELWFQREFSKRQR